MSSVKNILAGAALSFAALGFLGSTPAQAGVVVKSSGPSAETYPVGKKLDDAASTHRVGARGASKRTAFAMLTRQQSGARVRTGAVRGGATGSSTNSNLWNIDISRPGKVCLPAGDAITFWRPSIEGGETWVLGSAISDFHLHFTFEDGSATASLSADELPLAQNRLYDLSGPAGGAKQRLEFIALDETPQDPEDLAVALANLGCMGQLDLLSEKLAS
jgi:hypothetical protein